MKAIELIKGNAKSYNRHLTDEYFDGLTEVQKLGLVHPADRVELAKMQIAEISGKLKKTENEPEINRLKTRIVDLQNLIILQKKQNEKY